LDVLVSVLSCACRTFVIGSVIENSAANAISVDQRLIENLPIT
jgi:hypothetical protein